MSPGTPSTILAKFGPMQDAINEIQSHINSLQWEQENLDKWLAQNVLWNSSTASDAYRQFKQDWWDVFDAVIKVLMDLKKVLDDSLGNYQWAESLATQVWEALDG